VGFIKGEEKMTVDLTEVKLSRDLARALEQCIREGVVLPDEVKRAYIELCNHYTRQIQSELS
jgi:hypothetical protein